MPGTFAGYSEISVGHVNQTYKVEMRQNDGSSDFFIVQKVNTYAFDDPVLILENAAVVTEHIREKRMRNNGQDPDAHKVACVEFLRTRAGKLFLSDGSGIWRICNFVPSDPSPDYSSLKIIENAGAAFGHFTADMADLPPSALHVTSPGFHDTVLRFQDLEKAAASDPMGRASKIRAFTDRLMEYKEQACALSRLASSGGIPLRIVHNDTKLNNVLFEAGTGDAIAVIDFDTIMPGYLPFDFGDAVRYAANPARDSYRYEDVAVDLEAFQAFARGYLPPLRSILTENEKEALSNAPFTLSCELACRYAVDYLTGDRYFRTIYPDQNADKVQCQLRLAGEFLEKLPEIKSYIDTLL